MGTAEGGPLTFALFFCCIMMLSVPNPLYASSTIPQEYEQASAFRVSQAAIGKSLGNYSFRAAVETVPGEAAGPTAVALVLASPGFQRY